MKILNPWIDPRVAQLRPEVVRAFLMSHGWQEVGPAENPHLVRYEVAGDHRDAPTLFLPLGTDNGAALQWLIELIGELAVWEDRFAGDLLTDILQPAPNGAATDRAPTQTPNARCENARPQAGGDQ
jgi:hypothetical protein